MTLIAPTLEAFFTDRLMTQKNASPRTIAAYRDTLRLLLRFAQEKTGKQPCDMDFADLDAPLIGAFLTHLEKDRGNTVRTRNARLAAIHSLYRYAPSGTPSTPAASAACSRSQPNNTTARRSPTSTSSRSKHCSPRPTNAPGSAAATTR